MSQFDTSNISNQSIQFTYSGSTIFMPSGISSASFKVTGSDLNNFVEKSASVILELEPTLGKHLQFRIPSGAISTSEDAIPFFISKSVAPKIGIGTSAPLSTLDIVDVEDTADGFVFLIRNARTITEGGKLGDAAGTINFIITSGSYDKVDTSGSVGKIVSEVDAVSDEGVGGHIRFEVSDIQTANLSNDPVEVLRLVKDTSNFENVTVKVTGSLSSTEKLKAGSAIEATTYITAGDYVQASDLLIGDSLKIGTPTNPGSGNAIINGTLEANSVTTTSITASIISASSNITSSDVYIDDWGSVSASLASAGGGGAVATFTNGADNRIITATGTDGINGEANLTFDGSKLLVSGSGSTLLEVMGSEGQLFSITDSLSGSLFAVSDVSGIPILEVFSDDTVKIGSFNNEAIIVTGSTAIASGSFSGSFQGDGSNLTGVGNVSNTSTPLDNQIAVWTNSTTIEGTAGLTFDGTSFSVQANTHNLDGGNVSVDGNTTIYQDGGLTTAGDITGSDVNITGFSSVSASLASAGNVSNFGTPLDNQVAVWKNTTTIEGDADFTWSGTILTIDGSTKTRLTAVANDGIGGTVNAAGEFGYGAEVWQGPGVSGDTTAGKIYYLTSGGTMALASSGSAAAATGFISYATSTASVNGMVLRGFVYVGTLGQSPGDKMYLADNGTITPTLPSTSTHFVRIVGYASHVSGIIYFNPSNDYIQLA